jgi:hypothetical protein
MLQACMRPIRPTAFSVIGARALSTAAAQPGLRQFGGVSFQKAAQAPPPATKLDLIPKPTSNLLQKGLMFGVFAPTAGLELESVFDVIGSDVGPYFLAGLWLAWRACMKPQLTYFERIVHLEACAFILYGYFFIAFASNPFLYWIFYGMLFTGGAKTLMFCWLANPFFKIGDQPMRVAITLKRHAGGAKILKHLTQ